MAGWPLPPSSAPSGNPVIDIIRKLQSAGFCLDLDAAKEDDNVDFAAVFDRVVLTFLGEILVGREEVRVPVLLGDGGKVDLLRLYDAVGDKGGYDAVTESCGWAEVAVAAGFDSRLGSSLKLVFFKYLNVLEKCLQRMSGKSSAGDRHGHTASAVSSLIVAGGSSPAVPDHMEVWQLEPPLMSEKENQLLSQVVKDGYGVQLDNGDDEVVITGTRMANGGSNHPKRKREYLVGMLNWVRKLAMDPHTFIEKRMSSTSKGKGKSRSSWEICMQAQRARQAMFLSRTSRRNPGLPNLQEERKSHYCIYENGIDGNPPNVDQCFQTISKTNISATSEIHAKGLVVAGKKKTSTVQSFQNLYFGGTPSWLAGDEMLVPLGTRFQAEVPAWTGRPTEHPTDSESLKWLGTRFWPPESDEKKPVNEKDLIGKVRNHICYCMHQGSVECIRFHITEKRMQLKCELGRAFYAWGFERMGEEVSLSWTEDEQLKFKAIIHSNRPSVAKDFWEELQSYFISKGTRNLVSYYFNVYLLERRRYQNRATAANIDSDDDETEFCFSSIPFGHAAVKIRDSETIFCAQNKQCELSE